MKTIDLTHDLNRKGLNPQVNNVGEFGFLDKFLFQPTVHLWILHREIMLPLDHATFKSLI